MGFILVSYDIPDNKRRTKLAHILEDYGERVHAWRSVFECQLTARQQQKLLKEIKAVLVAAEDSVRLYGLCAACRGKVLALGQAEPPAEPPQLYIV